LSVPIDDYATANEEMAKWETKTYYSCCGKSVCGGCVHSFRGSRDKVKCPFCNSDRGGKTDEDKVEEMIKRAEVNDAASVYVLANCYHQGLGGLQQNHAKTMELLARAADLGDSKAHYSLAGLYYEGGDMKKGQVPP
jgi:TPR repeat protein